MPLYRYHCLSCDGTDHRVAGLDDQVAICTECGDLMLRDDQDVFRPYFRPAAEPDPWADGPVLIISPEPAQVSRPETDENLEAHRPQRLR
jgi:hypothetical protein